MKISALIRTTLLILVAAVTGFTAAAEQWAQPKVSVAILRSEPRHAAEQVSQVVMGTPLKVIKSGREWWQVETPEGYTGYIRNNTLTPLSDGEMAQWRKSRRGVVTADRTIYVTVTPTADELADRVTDIVNGSIVRIGDVTPASTSGIISGDNAGDVITSIILPDGRKGYLPARYLKPIEQWADQTWDATKLPSYASRLMGTPYVWGGTSTKGMDCSGLTQITAYRYGVLLPRDASQQIKVGTVVDKSRPADFKAGDLLFFGNVNTGRVTHVAISQGGYDYIHSSARVRQSSLDPASPLYENPGLIGVRRIDETTAGKLALKSHPWYF